MARLFDELRAKKYIPINMPVIQCDNVMNYLYSLLDTKKFKIFSNKDYPCTIPPFPVCYFEFKNPLGGTFGVVVIYRDEEKTAFAKFYLSGIGESPVGHKWIMNDTGLIVYDSVLIHPHHGLNDENINIYKRLGSTAIVCVYTTISFMHCKKQTKFIEHIPPEKVQRKRKKHNKPPLTKYYTLDIEPLKEILRTEGRVHEVGLPKALHICRGHFKDYSQGKGLFGKYKGLYWWDSHIRGNEDAGTIIKDYAVNLPEVEGFN